MTGKIKAHPAAKLQPILDEDLDRACQFYHAHLDKRIATLQWKQAFSQPWISNKPNNGYMLVAEGRVVGVFGAIYSEQIIRGKRERFCNHSSWMVLAAYRRQSLSLLTAVLEDSGYHIISTTPNRDVAEICAYVGGLQYFDNRVTVLPNLPWPCPSAICGQIVTDLSVMQNQLEPAVWRDIENHLQFSWLGQLVIGKPGAYCYVVFKKKIWKRSSCAFILHISNPQIFLKYHRKFCHHLLIHHAALTTHIPSRFLPTIPVVSMQTIDPQPRQYISDTLGQGDLSFLYTELLALDLGL